MHRIAKLYKQPGHPIAFSSPKTVYDYFRGRVPLSKIKKALEHVDSYTLHREYKRPKVHNPYYTYNRRRQFQADLIDISGLKRANDNVTFLLVVIDIFSRKIWVMPLKRKTGKETASALRAWFENALADEEEDDRRSFLTDSGKEFLNAEVRSLMREKGVRMYQAKNVNKAAIVERVNKSLQILIYKYLTDSGEARYLDVLPRLVSGYNNRKHSTLNNFTPNEADLERNEIRTRAIHTNRYANILMKSRKKRGKRPRTKRKESRFAVGDRVRIKTLAKAPSSARRSYLQQFHGEYFEIERVDLRMPVTMYWLRSMNTEELIEGGFYANEMTHVRGDIFKIDEIIRTRGRGAKREYFVRWKHFSPRWNSWVKADDVDTNAL